MERLSGHQDRESATAEITVLYQHPQTTCMNSGDRITRSFEADTINQARVLAENDPPVCECGVRYQIESIY